MSSCFMIWYDQNDITTPTETRTNIVYDIAFDIARLWVTGIYEVDIFRPDDYWRVQSSVIARIPYK